MIKIVMQFIIILTMVKSEFLGKAICGILAKFIIASAIDVLDKHQIILLYLKLETG